MTEIVSVQLAVDAVGSAILHSLWQGALLGILTALALRALQGSAANLRYAVACLGLAAFTLAWLTTVIGSANPVDSSKPAGLTTYSGPAPSDMSPGSTFSFPASRIAPNAAASLTPWAERLESWSRAVVPLWFIGVLGLSIRLAFGWLSVARIRRAANEPLTGLWPESVRAIAGRLRISKPVRVAQSAIVNVPMLIGWVRPVILIPASVVSGLTIVQLEAVIAHELAHVRRHDYIANIIQTAAEILLFYHPACWWISKQIRAEREHCCDDLAVSVCGDRVLYAEALANLETLRGETPVPGLAATDGVLMRRIRRLVTAAPRRRSLSPGWAAAAVPLVAVGLVLLNTNIAGTAGPDTETLQRPASPADRSLASDEAVVRGQVVDARSGRPVPEARVIISRADRSWTASTSTEGRYEVSGLAPGEYSLDVRAQGYVPGRYGQRQGTERGSTLDVGGGRYTTGINLRLEPAGTVTGRVFDDRGEGLAGVEVELLAERHLPDGIRPVGVGFAQTEAEGAFKFADVLPGDYYVRAYVSPSVRPSPANGQAYVSTFYPGVPRSEYGQQLRVSSGQELFGINFPLATTSTHRISGVVVDPAGGPPRQRRVHLRARGLNSIDTQYDASVDSNGRFEVSDVVPGNYIISVIEPRSTTSRWMSATRVVAVDDDIDDLELRARLGANVTGRIVRDPAATRSFDPAGVMVVFGYRLSGDGGTGLGWGGVHARGANGAMRIGSDGAFSIESPGGMSVVRVSELPANWTLKAVRLDGADITDQPVDFGAGTRKVEIVLTDRISIVRGNVMDRSGRPMGNVSVVLFADDSTLWEGESSRFVRETRSERDGAFELTGMPPGDHLAVAIENLPPQAWMNIEVLKLLRPLATRFRLDEGGEHVVSLRVSTAPDGLIPVY